MKFLPALLFVLIFFKFSPTLTFAAAPPQDTMTMVHIDSSGIDNAVVTVDDSDAQMATGMRSNGMIFVVIGVILIILAGLFFYLIQLDRKIKRLEKEIEQPKNRE